MPPKREVVYGKEDGNRKRRKAIISKYLSLDFPAIDMGFVPNQFESKPLVPARPDSQRAAMSAEPSSEQIETVASFTGCDPDTAKRFLKVSKEMERFAATNTHNHRYEH
jgi:hypothetical protein